MLKGVINVRQLKPNSQTIFSVSIYNFLSEKNKYLGHKYPKFYRNYVTSHLANNLFVARFGECFTITSLTFLQVRFRYSSHQYLNILTCLRSYPSCLFAFIPNFVCYIKLLHIGPRSKPVWKKKKKKISVICRRAATHTLKLYHPRIAQHNLRSHKVVVLK